EIKNTIMLQHFPQPHGFIFYDSLPRHTSLRKPIVKKRKKTAKGQADGLIWICYYQKNHYISCAFSGQIR
ncbi:MAG: hypothetical protein IKN57_08770, partial [Parasporobacterium sp.]|nr:hypothetical protein [Parasporobacterium sp.]